MKKHEHNWKKIYFRKQESDKSFQSWKTIPDTFVCDICLEIRNLKKGETTAEQKAMKRKSK